MHSDRKTHAHTLSLSLSASALDAYNLLSAPKSGNPDSYLNSSQAGGFSSPVEGRGPSQSHPPRVAAVSVLRLLLQQPQAGSQHLPVTAALCGERGRAVARTSGCWSASKHRTPEPAPSPAGLCGKQGGSQGAERAACRSLSSPVLIGRGDLPLDSCLHRPCLQGCTRSTPSLGQPTAGPRDTELVASREGRQRQQTVAAALLGVILTWFVLGQMAALNGLLARLGRFLFILRPQLAGKQQVMAQRHSSAIRRQLDEKESFSVLTSGTSAQCVDVCLSVCLFLFCKATRGNGHAV